MNKLSEFGEGALDVGSTRRVVYILLFLPLLGDEGTSLTSEFLPRGPVSLLVSTNITIDFLSLAIELGSKFSEHGVCRPLGYVKVKETGREGEKVGGSNGLRGEMTDGNCRNLSIIGALVEHKALMPTYAINVQVEREVLN